MSTDFHYWLFLAFLIIAAVAVFWIPSTPTLAEPQHTQTCPY